MLKLYGGLVFILVQFVVLGDRSHKTTKPTLNPLARFIDKFYQSDYKLTFERIERLRIDKRYAEFECRTFKYNRTTPLFNGTGMLKLEVGYKTEMIFQMYRFASNEYRLFPARFELNLCEAIASSVVGLSQLMKAGNIDCPLVKGKKYYVVNYSPEEERFPPFMPNGQYMVEVTFMVGTIEVVVFKVFFIIYRPIPIPD